MKAHRALSGAALLFLCLVAVWLPRPGAAQAADLEQLLRLHYQAINRGDAAAVLADFTEDAVVIRGGCVAVQPCRGTAPIRGEIQVELQNRVSYGLLSSSVADDTVSARAEFWNVNIAAARIQRAIYKATITFRGDKISRWVQEEDLSDPQSVVFANFQRVALPTGAINQAINRGDVAAAATLLTDDAVLEGLGPCLATPCAGKQAAQRAIESWIADKTSFTTVPGTVRVSGNDGTGVVAIRSDSVRTAGLERLLATWTRSVNQAGDRITGIRFVLNADDAETAAFTMRGQPATPTPAQLPRTGSGGLKSLILSFD